jgi:hypothetical protein
MSGAAVVRALKMRVSSERSFVTFELLAVRSLESMWMRLRGTIHSWTRFG